MNEILAILKNADVKKVVLWTVIIIAVLVLLRNKHKIKTFFKRVVTTPKGDFEVGITEDEKDDIERVADELKEKIYGMATNQSMAKLLNLSLGYNDSAFLYFVEYYNDTYGDLYDDIDWEFMPDIDADEKVMARMQQMNLA